MNDHSYDIQAMKHSEDSHQKYDTYSNLKKQDIHTSLIIEQVVNMTRTIYP
jgi:hypothetical protein